jgi:hypothetical protein
MKQKGKLIKSFCFEKKKKKKVPYDNTKYTVNRTYYKKGKNILTAHNTWGFCSSK